MAVIKQKKNDQEVIRTKQSNLLCHWEQSWELSNLGQPILFPEAINNNPPRSIPRNGPLGKIRTKKCSINQCGYSV